jgi:hypothetical protein
VSEKDELVQSGHAYEAALKRYESATRDYHDAVDAGYEAVLAWDGVWDSESGRAYGVALRCMNRAEARRARLRRRLAETTVPPHQNAYG